MTKAQRLGVGVEVGGGFFLQVPCGQNTQQLGASGRGHTQRPALCVVSKGPLGQTAAPGWLRCFGGGWLSPWTSHGALLLCMQGLRDSPPQKMTLSVALPCPELFFTPPPALVWWQL